MKEILSSGFAPRFERGMEISMAENIRDLEELAEVSEPSSEDEYAVMFGLAEPRAEEPEVAEEPEAPAESVPAEESAPASSVSEEAEEVLPEEPVETMEDYKEELEASFRQIHAGDIMDGRVIDVNETGVLMDLNYYAPGFVPVEEMSADPHFDLLGTVHVGDEFSAVVKRRDDGRGNLLLSKKEADSELGWDKLKKMMDEETVITGKVTETVPKGAIMFVEGIRGFIPASRLALTFVEDTSLYMNRTLSVRVIDVDEEDEKLVLSAREILTEAAIEEKNQRINKMEPGTVVEGTVESLKNYGAFVDLGEGISGLLHVSQITEKRINHPGAVLKVGQQVKVLITKIENGRLSLSMKALNDVLNKEQAEESVEEYSDHSEATTSLGDLLKGFKF